MLACFDTHSSSRPTRGRADECTAARLSVAARMLAILALVLTSGSSVAIGQEPQPQSMHLFVLAGQSNMAGRGLVADEDRIVHPRVFTLDRNGKWIPAVDPLHWDKKAA